MNQEMWFQTKKHTTSQLQFKNYPNCIRL